MTNMQGQTLAEKTCDRIPYKQYSKLPTLQHDLYKWLLKISTSIKQIKNQIISIIIL